MAVAVLGSETVDVNTIDKSSVLLAGVAPLPWPQTTWFDLGFADGDNDCVCDYPQPPHDDSASDDSSDGAESMGDLMLLNRDGYKDLLLFFSQVELAEAIGDVPAPGDVITLTLTGLYDDEMDFTSMDCVTIVGTRHSHRSSDDFDDDSSDDAVALGYPSPNPFNPVN